MEHNSGSNRASNFKSIIDLKLRARGKYEQCMGKLNVRSNYMLNHRTRGLLFHYKKSSYFFGKSIQKYPDCVCENDVNNEQNVRA